MLYSNEVSKIRERVMPYLIGDGMDIGCYDCKVVPNAFGIDGRKAEGVDLVTDGLYELPKKLPDLVDKMSFVFSSHTLEHLHDHYRAIIEWSYFLKKGGYFILYLPQAGRYDNFENKEHIHNTDYESFLMWFTRTFCGEGRDFKGGIYLTPVFELVESGQDPHEEDLYSFYLVSQKL